MKSGIPSHKWDAAFSYQNQAALFSWPCRTIRPSTPLNTTTINDLCCILQCQVEDVMTYVPSAEDQHL